MSGLVYLLHAFSLDMVQRVPVRVIAFPVDDLPRNLPYLPCVGLEAVARLLAEHLDDPRGWEAYLQPQPVVLRPGDVAYVARYRGPLPPKEEPDHVPGSLEFWGLRFEEPTS